MQNRYRTAFRPWCYRTLRPAAQRNRSLRERRAAVRGLYNLLRFVPPSAGLAPGLHSSTRPHGRGVLQEIMKI